MTIEEIKRQAIKAARKVKKEDVEEAINFFKEELTAQEMFEKLGYTKHNGINNELIYLYDEERSTKLVTFYEYENSFACYYSPKGEAYRIDAELFKAINQQCKELGWL